MNSNKSDTYRLPSQTYLTTQPTDTDQPKDPCISMSNQNNSQTSSNVLKDHDTNYCCCQCCSECVACCGRSMDFFCNCCILTLCCANCN
jgi:hypothetical protein